MEFEVTVKETSKEAFTKAFQLFDNNENVKFKCNGYKIEDGKLFLSGYNEKERVELPYEFNLEQTIEFAWGWLEASRLDPLSRPDFEDKTKEQAFEITNQELEWGGSYGWICTVKPIWFIHGK